MENPASYGNAFCWPVSRAIAVPRFLSLFIRNGILYLLPLAVLAAATAARLAVPAVLDRLSLICFDLYQREAPRQPGDEPIRIVDIDDFSINKVGQWP